ncbi:MAG: hypothetical protein PHC68_16115 [Syntrophorhabdaceae bacterium]|nr:hypothetical protein [Syntrophorhabdaceae bacterium]
MKFYDDEHTDWADVLFWVMVAAIICILGYGGFVWTVNFMGNF